MVLSGPVGRYNTIAMAVVLACVCLYVSLSVCLSVCAYYTTPSTLYLIKGLCERLFFGVYLFLVYK